MNTQILAAPVTNFIAQDTCEYLLVVKPPADIHDLLMEEKQEFYNTYKERAAIKGQPYITVANFMAKETMEETLIRYMHRITSTQSSFTVTCNNYSGYPPHTVFVRVQQPEPFKQLAASLKAIDQYVRSNGYPPARLTTHPHISIAKRLPERVYDKAMLDFSQRLFHASFVANELVLLRRENLYAPYKQVNVFRLKEESSISH